MRTQKRRLSALPALVLTLTSILTWSAEVRAQSAAADCQAVAGYSAAQAAAQAAQARFNAAERALPEALRRRFAPYSLAEGGGFSHMDQVRTPEELALEYLGSQDDLITEEAAEAARETNPPMRAWLEAQGRERRRLMQLTLAWLDARKARDLADAELERRTIDYPLAAKDALLASARSTAARAQSAFQAARARLDARKAEASYRSELAAELQTTRSQYQLAQSSLDPYACFADVRALRDDLAARVARIDANLATLARAGAVPPPTPPVTPPTPPVVAGTPPPIIGRWSGRYENSKGDKGSAYLRFSQAADGKVTGEEEGYAITITTISSHSASWTYLTGECLSGSGTLSVTADGQSASGSYAVNRCGERYTGSYINYTK